MQSNCYRLLKSAKRLSGDTIFVSSRLPNKWRVWFLGNKVIQITVGERAIFETGEWSTPQQSAVVVVGPRYDALGLLLANMEPAHGTH